MAFNPNKQREKIRDMLARERAAIEDWEKNRALRDARHHTMALWNAGLAAGWRTMFYPSVGTAKAVGCYWLHVICPACQVLGEVDLREVDIHPDASIGVVIRMMSCRACRPNPPFARPLGATRRSWYGRSWPKTPKREKPQRLFRIRQWDDLGWGEKRELDIWNENERRPVCNLYSQTKGQAAIIELTRALRDLTGNLMPQPGIFPDYRAPIVRNASDGVRELANARWGMPSSKVALMEATKKRAQKLEARGKQFDFRELLRMEPDRGTTNIRNTASSHWQRWLGVEHRCLVPFTSFSEFNKAEGGDVWFAFDESRPLAFFAGIWTNWTSVRKVAEGETTNDLYGFLTTEPNAEVGGVHPKAMPVILRTGEEIETWLTAPADEALKLQRPLPNGSLRIVARGVKEDGSDA